MAPEDPGDPGHPDPSTASDWTDLEDIASLNGLGYTFVRIRITFMLPPDQTAGDPLPIVGRLSLNLLCHG